MKSSISFLTLFTLFFTSYSQIDETKFPEQHRQFDFWIGEWDVNLRIQQENGEWLDQVKSTARIYPILDGKAILELWNENKFGEGIKGYSLRYYREDLQKWELWLNWPGDNRSGSSSLSGNFRHGRGEFFSEYQKNDSVTITSRYTFSDITPNSLRWDDSFSEDGGKTFKQGNWIMEFTRKEEFPPEMDHSVPLLTYDSGKRCDLPEFDFFNNWSGSWAGEAKELRNGKWEKSDATYNVYKILDGCAVMTFLQYGSQDKKKVFTLSTFNTYAGTFEVGTFINDRSAIFDIRYAPLNEDVLVLQNREKDSKLELRRKKNELVFEVFDLEDEKWISKKVVSLKKT